MGRVRTLRAESLERRQLLAADTFQNPLDAADVDNDGAVTLQDAVAVLSHEILTSSGVAVDSSQLFLDCNGDQQVTIGDMAQVVGRLVVDSSGTGGVEDLLSRLALAPLPDVTNGLSQLVATYREQGESQLAVLGRVIGAEAPDADTLRAELEQLLADHAAAEQTLRDQLDDCLQTGLDQAANVLAQVRADASAAAGRLSANAAAIIEQHLGEGRLRARVDQWLGELESSGVIDQTVIDDVHSFLDQVESGAVTVPSSVQQWLEQLRDRVGTLPARLDELLLNLDANADSARDAFVDLLNQYEQAGHTLPPRLAELRDMLAAGATPLRDELRAWIARLGNHVPQAQQAIDNVLAELADGVWNVPIPLVDLVTNWRARLGI